MSDYEKLRDEITGALVRGADESITSAIFGCGYTSVTKPEVPGLTFERLMQMHDYCKPEYVTIKGERLELFGWKVHQSRAVPEGVVVVTEKMYPDSTELGKLIILFVNEGKGVIYDPAKLRPEPPFEPPRFEPVFGIQSSPAFVSSYLARTRRIVAEKWPELICGPDDFFEVFDLVDSDL